MTKSIADAEAKIEDLTTKIALEKKVAENQEALDQATAIREKELAEFNAEEKDALQAIPTLKSAVTVLGKHHDSAFVQMPRGHLEGIANTIQYQMQKHAVALQGVMTHTERRVIAAFIQNPQDYFDAELTFKQSYAPQSGEIFGILKQMKESFETNLPASQKEEMANQKAYEDVKAAKTDEIKAGQDQIDIKIQEFAITDEKWQRQRRTLRTQRHLSHPMKSS